ncbi:MAG TPA: TRAP transporter small permease subunit [Longimicrobiales bacterium]|nr:TRAP transporter small permease subunit [Longimicrobiales bacterium]
MTSGDGAPPEPGRLRVLLRVAGAIDRLNDWIYAGIRWLIPAMVVLGACNALLRYLNRWTHVSLTSNAAFELQWYLFSLVFLLGAAYGLNRDVHVRVDVLYSRFGPRYRKWVDFLGTVFFAIPFSILMLVTCWPAVRNSWLIREGSPDPGGLPRYPIKTVILVCFVLLLLQSISLAIKGYAALREGRGAPGDGGGVD